ncbi:Deoxyhypusine synthase [Cucumispora dikerogammari]|nr:Deoxyhypusine synthase [Cucumispora dikerogammari]
MGLIVSTNNSSNEYNINSNTTHVQNKSVTSNNINNNNTHFTPTQVVTTNINNNNINNNKNNNINNNNINNNKVHILNADIKIAKLIFKTIIEKKLKLYFSFTGLLLNSKNNKKKILKILNYATILVTTSCAIYKEITIYKPNLNIFKNQKLNISTFLNLLGKEINNKKSFLFKCYIKNIKVFMPILEGPLSNLLIDLNMKLNSINDVIELNRYSLFCESEVGCLILGIGVVKHHLLNSNLFREGSDFTILVNTAIEFDGSDGGADIEEAKSWGKVRSDNIDYNIKGIVCSVDIDNNIKNCKNIESINKMDKCKSCIIKNVKVRCCPSLILNELLKGIK